MNQRDFDVSWVQAQVFVENLFGEFDTVWQGERMEQDELETAELESSNAMYPLGEDSGVLDSLLGQAGAVDMGQAEQFDAGGVEWQTQR